MMMRMRPEALMIPTLSIFRPLRGRSAGLAAALALLVLLAALVAGAPARAATDSVSSQSPLARALANAVLTKAEFTKATPAGSSSQVLTADAAFALSASRDRDGAVRLQWRIAPGTYLYRDSLKATRDGVAIALTTPPAETKDDPNFGPVEVYHHEVAARAGHMPASGALLISFQGCAEDGICYPEVRRELDLSSLAISAALPAGSFKEPVDPAPAQAGAGRSGTIAASAPPAPPAAPASDAEASDAATGAGRPLLTGNLLVMLAAFLGFGLVLAFTPCVFPMLPILSGILAGGGARPTPARGFALSAAYGLAMAAAYGALGLAAGWSGANLQAALQTPWALGAMAAVFMLLALSMFGLFDLALPAFLTNRFSGGSRGGSVAGAASLGFASALVVGPCVTPPLAAAMLYAAQTGDAARGGAALFMLGLGMGLPLVLIGTFGAQVLPRSGPWLSRIKQACGVLFLGIAAVLAARLMPATAALALWGALLLGLGVFLGALDRLHARSPWPARLSQASGLLAVIAGATLVVGAAGGSSDPLRPLAFLTPAPQVTRVAEAAARVTSPAALTAAVAEATASGRPALVSFTADWCTVCRSNEKVLAEPQVMDRLARLPRIAADVTTYGAGERELMERFSVVGPPTLFLIDAQGRELPGSRHIGPLSVADVETLITQAGL